MPVVVDPGVLNPYEFIGAVINRRLPNPFMPDAPQRIATDTSQKLAIRFGETIKAYEERGLDKSNLVLIPLVLAGYARYLKGIDDNGQPFEISPDPLLAEDVYKRQVVHGGGVLLPVAFPQTGLHVLRAGVFVGSVQKGRFVPEHHLFTAFGSLCTNCEQLTLADCRCTEYLSGREVEARTAADGWCCVTVDGWPLGGGKVSGGRVKNHYPKALRLL